MSFTLDSPFQYFNNPNNSNPVGLGRLYVGLPDTDPEQVSNRVTVKAVQPNGSELAISQPVQLLAGGVPSYNGSPVQLKIDAETVSIKVANSSGAQVYYAPQWSPSIAYADISSATSTALIGGVQVRKLVTNKVFAIQSMPDSQFYFIKTNNTASQDRAVVLAALQSLIDSVSALSTGETEIDLGGYTYAINGTLSVKNRVWLVNGTIDDNDVTAGNSVILIGNPLGGSLCRPAGCRNIYLKTSSTAAPVAGFRIDTLVRSSGIENCIAEMNATSTREQNGFEITSTTIAEATAGGVGAYQNWIEDCTAINAYWAARVYTRGTKSQALADPQANGNRIDIRAFSCYRGAVDFGYGAQENIFEMRADTFVTQVAPARIDIINLDGSFNYGNAVEEIGSRAPTQYSVRIGDEAIYNDISVSTQNIVSGLIDESSSPIGKRAKNIIKQTGSALISSATGATGDFGVAQSVAAAQSQFIIGTFVAPSRCVVSRFVGVLQSVAPSGGQTRIYAAKNSNFVAENRISWDAGDAIVAKSIIPDSSASLDISPIWILSAGDFITFAVDTPSGGGVPALASILVKYF